MDDEPMSEKRKVFAIDRAVAAGNLLVALCIGLAASRVPTPRPSWVLALTAIVIGLLVSSSAGLALGARWAGGVTRAAAVVLLAGGAVATSGLTLGLTFFRAVGGPGAGLTPILFTLGLLVVLPYAVLYPAALLLWLRSRGRPR